MAASSAFGNLEQTGWGSATVALAYHRNLGEVTSGCIPELIRAADLNAGDRVLDVACGVGYVAAAARDHGADAIGLDFSAVQIRLARQTYPDIRFVEGNAEALPFADGEFDAVLNAFGLPHLPDPDRHWPRPAALSNPPGALPTPRGATRRSASLSRWSMTRSTLMAHWTWGCLPAPTSSAMANRASPPSCSPEPVS